MSIIFSGKNFKKTKQDQHTDRNSNNTGMTTAKVLLGKFLKSFKKEPTSLDDRVAQQPQKSPRFSLNTAAASASTEESASSTTKKSGLTPRHRSSSKHLDKMYFDPEEL